MASITIRNFRGPLKLLLKEQAERNGRSVKEEARAILAQALKDEPDPSPHDVDMAKRVLKRA